MIRSSAFILLAALLAAGEAQPPPVPAPAPLCADCVDKVFTTDVGICLVCGKATGSSAFKRCDACASKEQVCRACAAKLPAKPAGTPPTQPEVKRP